MGCFMGNIIIKLVLASICGGAIGFERENKNKNAGIRTYMTVCLSTTIVMIIAQRCFIDTRTGDLSRMAAAALQGIGFLGAGLIIQKDNKLMGITTAAILWATAVIGLAIGYGLYFLGVIGTLFMLVIGNIRMTQNFSSRDQKVGNTKDVLKKKKINQAKSDFVNAF